MNNKRKKPNRSSFGYKLIRQYPAYLFRWQLSTPILALITAWLTPLGFWISAAIANLIGGLIFFWVDRCIFTNRQKYRVQLEFRHFPEDMKEQNVTIENARYTAITELCCPIEVRNPAELLYVPLLWENVYCHDSVVVTLFQKTKVYSHHFLCHDFIDMKINAVMLQIYENGKVMSIATTKWEVL